MEPFCNGFGRRLSTEAGANGRMEPNSSSLDLIHRGNKSSVATEYMQDTGPRKFAASFAPPTKQVLKNILYESFFVWGQFRVTENPCRVIFPSKPTLFLL